MPSFSTFMCCHVDGELLYMNPDYVDCDGNKVDNDFIAANQSKAKIALSDEILHISLEGNNSFDVHIYSMQGMLVAQQNKNYCEAGIPLTGLPKGFYIIRVTSGNNVYTHKILK